MKAQRFVWKAVDTNGIIQHGVWVGNEISDIQGRLKNEGYFPVAIRTRRDWKSVCLPARKKFQCNPFGGGNSLTSSAGDHDLSSGKINRSTGTMEDHQRTSRRRQRLVRSHVSPKSTAQLVCTLHDQSWGIYWDFRESPERSGGRNGSGFWLSEKNKGRSRLSSVFAVCCGHCTVCALCLCTSHVRKIIYGHGHR